MTIVFKISENLKPSIIKFYQTFFQEKCPPYAVFQAKTNDTTITLYESGKIMFQGLTADIEAAIWIDLEKKHNNKIIDINAKNKQKEILLKNYDNYNTVGSDEVGTGDYFGPIVVTACYVAKDQANFLHSLKITDSKQLSDTTINNLVPQIIDKILSATIIITPEIYNKNYNKEFNMNKIKAILHNKVLLKIIKQKPPYDKIIVDQFVNPHKYYEYLNDTQERVTNITFTPQAEKQALSVACASIISRFVFINEMAKLSQKLGKTIPKGAGIEVDKFLKENIKLIPKEKLGNYVKLNFKNTTKLTYDA